MNNFLRKALPVALCAALVGGTAITLPALVQNSGIVARAKSRQFGYSNGFFYEITEDDSLIVYGLQKEYKLGQQVLTLLNILILSVSQYQIQWNVLLVQLSRNVLH